MLEYNCKIQSKIRRKKIPTFYMMILQAISIYVNFERKKKKNNIGDVIFKDKIIKSRRKLLLNNRLTFRGKNLKFFFSFL